VNQSDSLQFWWFSSCGGRLCYNVTPFFSKIIANPTRMDVGMKGTTIQSSYHGTGEGYCCGGIESFRPVRTEVAVIMIALNELGFRCTLWLSSVVNMASYVLSSPAMSATTSSSVAIASKHSTPARSKAPCTRFARHAGQAWPRGGSAV